MVRLAPTRKGLLRPRGRAPELRSHSVGPEDALEAMSRFFGAMDDPLHPGRVGALWGPPGPPGRHQKRHHGLSPARRISICQMVRDYNVVG